MQNLFAKQVFLRVSVTGRAVCLSPVFLQSTLRHSLLMSSCLLTRIAQATWSTRKRIERACTPQTSANSPVIYRAACAEQEVLIPAPLPEWWHDGILMRTLVLPLLILPAPETTEHSWERMLGLPTLPAPIMLPHWNLVA